MLTVVAADAEAICEAITQPTMRFVPVKLAERRTITTIASVVGSMLGVILMAGFRLMPAQLT